MTGSSRTAGGSVPVGEHVDLAIPSPMDGTWTLHFDLARGPGGIRGGGLLTLSNGVCHAYTLTGRVGAGEAVVLTFTADRAAPASGGIRFGAAITPREARPLVGLRSSARPGIVPWTAASRWKAAP